MLEIFKVNETFPKVATSQARSIPNLTIPIISMLAILANISLIPTLIFLIDSEIVRPTLENIPLTSNVATMISRYSSIEPFPYENIFNKNNTKYYNVTPLASILKQ